MAMLDELTRREAGKCSTLRPFGVTVAAVRLRRSWAILGRLVGV